MEVIEFGKVRTTIVEDSVTDNSGENPNPDVDLDF